jgi:hypothetical protein
MLVGSMRVSRETEPQWTDVQRDALRATGVDPRHLGTDQASDARDNRPGLQQALASVQSGACLLVWTLDRLGRARPHRLSIVLTLAPPNRCRRHLGGSRNHIHRVRGKVPGLLQTERLPACVHDFPQKHGHSNRIDILGDEEHTDVPNERGERVLVVWEGRKRRSVHVFFPRDGVVLEWSCFASNIRDGHSLSSMVCGTALLKQHSLYNTTLQEHVPENGTCYMTVRLLPELRGTHK